MTVLRWSRASPWLLAALMGAAGTTHLLRPGVYRPLVPSWLGDPGPWVLGSGVAELACAAGLATRRTRRPAALATAALLVAVLPGNLQMAVDWSDRPAPQRIGAWARVPLQVPLVLWALSVARDVRPAPTARAAPRPPRSGRPGAGRGPGRARGR